MGDKTNKNEGCGGCASAGGCAAANTAGNKAEYAAGREGCTGCAAAGKENSGRAAGAGGGGSEAKEKAKQGEAPQKLPQSEFNDIKHVIAVMSGKGGVGKSSVSALLAVSLAKQGYRTGVLDADITGPSIPKMFGVRQKPMFNKLGIDSVPTPLGIRVMSINLLLENEEDPVIWRGPLIGNAVKQFWTDVIWGKLDYLIVDLPPGTGDAPLTVMQSLPLDGMVVVTSPQEVASLVVKKAVRMAKMMNIPVLGIVENMSYVICPDCGSRLEVFGPSSAPEISSKFDIPLLGRIPLDPGLAKLCDAGKVENYDENVVSDMLPEMLSKLKSNVKN